jgi:hypothetical protein
LDYGNGAEILGILLSEDIAVSLDAAILSASPASSVKPAGILNSIASLTPTSGANEAALRGDIALLVGVVGATGSANVAFIVSPTYALKLQTYRNVVGDNVQIRPSIAVPNGTIIAVVTDAFVSGFGSVPRVEASKDAVVHQEDTSPLPIGQPGNIVASPARSLFQTDSVALRCTLDVAFCLRSTAAVAWIQSVTW